MMAAMFKVNAYGRTDLGRERKRNEVLQMTIVDPELAVLDETDSGLDIDALRTVAEGVQRLHDDQRGFLIITHYQRMLDYITRWPGLAPSCGSSR